MEKDKTAKDMSALNGLPRFRTIVENMETTTLKDYGLHSEVTLGWGYSDDAKKERIVRMTINGEEAYIDLEELLHYTRAVL